MRHSKQLTSHKLSRSRIALSEGASVEEEGEDNEDDGRGDDVDIAGRVPVLLPRALPNVVPQMGRVVHLKLAVGAVSQRTALSTSVQKNLSGSW